MRCRLLGLWVCESVHRIDELFKQTTFCTDQRTRRKGVAAHRIMLRITHQRTEPRLRTIEHDLHLGVGEWRCLDC